MAERSPSNGLLKTCPKSIPSATFGQVDWVREAADLPETSEKSGDKERDECPNSEWSSLAALDLHRPVEDEGIPSNCGQGDVQLSSGLRKDQRKKVIFPGASKVKVRVERTQEEDSDDDAVVIWGTVREYPSRNNMTALMAAGGVREDEDEEEDAEVGTFCYWSNLGLVKENVGNSLLGGTHVPEGLRPTMSKIDPGRDSMSPELAMTPLDIWPSESVLLGRISIDPTSSTRTAVVVTPPLRKKKGAVSRAANKFIKMVRKKS
ncbi:hypothetical protein AAG570_013564 [Ranatra chinensis]|uniref:Uncharacterized protein n=1 Tax=Ranatra chinensis TaxID=642074 RepID=A0ABD0YCS2_9HEMI